MKYAHIGINLLLLSAIPNFAVHAESPSLIHLDLPPEFAKSSPFIQKLFTEDNLLSYDALIELIESIENDTLGPCTPEDMQQISVLIANLARQGLMPDVSEMEKAELEVDVAEMLSSNPFAETNYWIGDQIYSIFPAVYYYDGMTAVPCKGWFHKQWKHLKHFVHEHKTAIIIGTILVVAAVVIVATVATGGAAAAPVAAAGTAAGAAFDSKEESVKQSASQPTVIETADELKDVATQNNLLSAASLDAEQGRFIGSTLAHETVQTPPNFYPPFESSLTPAGHGATDLAFSTNQAPSYLSESYSSVPSCNLFMAQGDQSLKMGDYEQAIDYYNQAIEIDPQNNDAYLQRAYAYMGNDDLSPALSDYRTYNTHAVNQSTSRYSVDFCIGFAKGLPKGAVESANQLVSFAGELAQHPIDTTCQICKSFGTLASMTYSGEWKELSQALAPEVCDLVQKWDTLPSREQGELAGYLVGKYGGDILIPGAATKVLVKGVKGAEEMFSVARNVQIAEETLTLDAIIQSEKCETLISPIMARTATKPWTTEEISEIKRIEFPSRKELEFRERGVWESFQQFRKAEKLLEPYQGKYLPESQIRELIHESGIPTFPRPAGIPENYRIKISKDGAGMKYVHPNDEGTYIRVMPGKLHSEYSCQQHPYVVQVRNGKTLDNFGNIVLRDAIEAHVPINEFVYKK